MFNIFEKEYLKIAHPNANAAYFLVVGFGAIIFL